MPRWMKYCERILRCVGFGAAIAVLVYLGWRVMDEKVAIVKPIQYIGHADEAAYAAMGESLAEGRGLMVRYVSWHFLAYSPEIVRREDHWPPFMGAAIAPCFWAWGKAAWVAKLPAIFIGSVGLPVAAAALAYALCRRGYAAMIAGMLMLAHPLVYTESLKTLSDMATAMLVTAFCAALLSARTRPWLHVVAGVFAAAAYYAKGSEIMLLGLYPVMALLAEGGRVFRRRWVYLGMLTAVLLMAPWWYDNYMRYGNPVHSTQNYVSGYMGLVDWEKGTYTPYWSGKARELPRTADRWEKYGKSYWPLVADYREKVARSAMTGAGSERSLWGEYGRWGYWARDVLMGEYAPSDTFKGQGLREKQRTAEAWPVSEWSAPAWQLSAVGALFLVLAALCLRPVALGLTWWQRRKARELEEAEEKVLARRSSLYKYIGPPVALAVLIVVQGAFLAYLWEPQARFCWIFPPILAAMGCAFLALVVELPVRLAGQAGAYYWKRSRWKVEWLERSRMLRHWHLALTLVLGGWLYMHGDDVLARRAAASWLPALDRVQAKYLALPSPKRNGYPYTDQMQQVTMGKWIGENLPEAVIMTRFPWQLLFYCGPGNKAVAVPYASAEEIFSIARYYRCTHLLVDFTVDENRDISDYVAGRRGGLKAVENSPNPLYEMDFSKLPTKALDALYPIKKAGKAKE